MEYFIHHGGIIMNVTSTTHENECSIHDTIIVVGHEFFPKYRAVVEQWKLEQKILLLQATKATRTSSSRCQLGSGVKGPSARVVARRSACYDMETARMAFMGELGVDVGDYDYFVYVNCGLTGPGTMTAEHLDPPYQQQFTPDLPWTEAFTSKLNERVKMSGLTLNMMGLARKKNKEPHVQSFLYALDRKGVEIIQQSNSVYDCLAEEPPNQDPTGLRRDLALKEYMLLDIVMRYEIGMSNSILEAGYALSPLLHPRQPECTEVNKHNFQQIKCAIDMWYSKAITHFYHGQLPFLNQTLFHKSSRFLTPEIAQLLNYTGEMDFIKDNGRNFRWLREWTDP